MSNETEQLKKNLHQVTGDKAMESAKLELIQKMEEKQMSVSQVAEAIEFNPDLLKLYLVKDAYPIPKRIMDKMAAAINN
jgi:hypothetical protein